MGRLTEVQTNDESSFLPVSAESTEVSRIQQDFAQQERVPAIIAYSADDTLTEEQLAAIGDQVAAVRDRPEISDGEAVEIGRASCRERGENAGGGASEQH